MGGKAPKPVIQTPVAPPATPNDNSVASAPKVPTPSGQQNAGEAVQQTATGADVKSQSTSTDGRVRAEEERKRAQATARAAAASTILTAPLGLVGGASLGKTKLGS